MSKDTPWFRHDMDARHDEKMEALALEYGMLGHGRFWALVEMLRSSSDYRLAVTKHLWQILAKVWTNPREACNPEEAQLFVDCLVDLKLLCRDDNFVWSDSLCRRMNKLEEIRKIRQETGTKGAERKWGKSSSENSATRAQRLAEARKKGTHTDEEWQEMLSFFGCCVRCGSEKDIRKDHIKPIYQGGSDSITNLQPLCRTCNSSKGPDDTDHRISFCLANGLEMPGKWKEISTKCLANGQEMPGTRVEQSRADLEEQTEQTDKLKQLPPAAVKAPAAAPPADAAVKPPPPSSTFSQAILRKELASAGITLDAKQLQEVYADLPPNPFHAKACLAYMLHRLESSHDVRKPVPYFLKVRTLWIAEWKPEPEKKTTERPTEVSPDHSQALAELLAESARLDPETLKTAALSMARLHRTLHALSDEDRRVLAEAGEIPAETSSGTKEPSKSAEALPAAPESAPVQDNFEDDISWPKEKAAEEEEEMLF